MLLNTSAQSSTIPRFVSDSEPARTMHSIYIVCNTYNKASMFWTVWESNGEWQILAKNKFLLFGNKSENVRFLHLFSKFSLMTLLGTFFLLASTNLHVSCKFFDVRINFYANKYVVILTLFANFEWECTKVRTFFPISIILFLIPIEIPEKVWIDCTSRPLFGYDFTNAPVWQPKITIWKSFVTFATSWAQKKELRRWGGGGDRGANYN